MKSRFVSKFPNSIKNCFNNKPGQACISRIHTWPLKKENKKTIRKKSHTKKRRQNRHKVRPNSLYARTIKETMVNCFFSEARHVVVRVNVTPVLHESTTLIACRIMSHNILFLKFSQKPSHKRPMPIQI